MKNSELIDILYKNISENNQLSKQILEISDKISEQNIWKDDKDKIINKIFGFYKNNKNLNLLESEYKNTPFYNLIYKIVEELFLNTEEKYALRLLSSDLKEELETDIIYLLNGVLEFVKLHLIQTLKSNKQFLEFASKDYLSDEELKNFLNYINNFFWNILEDLLKWTEIEKFKEKINTEVEKIKLISSIK